jgi:class 3 adenylate cyclase/tetratricopeptide (TPR) repeat protein
MQCQSCDFDNPEGLKFCGKCGTKLSNHCQQCGFENPSGFQFCGECGAPLIRQAQSSKTIELDSQLGNKEAKVPEAERRQLTVMFCDLVGSMTLSEQLDPEELRDVVRIYQEVCAEVIDRFEGHIAQYLGDGLLVYFGYPLAHEDDAQRAVRAGLEIVGAIHELPLHNTRLQKSLQVRIGIHTGPVVVGEMGRGEKREQLALGDTLNIASRLQNLAEPNTVVISSTTYRLTEGLFECRDLGLHTLKGVSAPAQMYRVLGESGVRSRFEVAITKGLTPLVGREQEVELLLERWERVKEGMGQVVLMCGEPGIGKSRLVQELKECLSGEKHARIESRCSPYYQNSALYPVIDHLQRVLQLRREDSPEEKLGKLERTLEQYYFSLEETVPLFAPLLSLPFPDYYPPPNLSPQKQKQKTLEALLVWLLKEAERWPVLRIVEDLHWADPSTLEYLSLLVEQVPTARIFTLLTYRPDFIPPWGMRSHMTQIALNRLTRKQAEVMIDGIAKGKNLPAEVVQEVVAKADGVPLFVEELTKMVLESGLLREQEDYYELTRPLLQLAIPATLQDSLMARLDRLSIMTSSGTIKEVAQIGATIGREFTYDLINAVSSLEETILQDELSKLVSAEILYQIGLLPNARYFFKHTLIQEAAYQSLLKSKRQQYHQKIAQILEEQFSETAETQPELLALHFTEAGFKEKGIYYWKKAGQRAIERSANMEAIAHLTKGLELLKSLPDTPERTQQELMLQIALGAPLRVTKGFGAPEVEKAYARARELCQQVGETPQVFTVLRGLCGFYLARADLQTSRGLGGQSLRLAQSLQDSALLLQAHYLLGATLFCLGEITLSREHLEQGIALYNPRQHSSHAFIYGQDPGVACLFWLAWALWYLGYPDKSCWLRFMVGSLRGLIL